MHPAWLWFQQAREKAKDPEFDVITDDLTEKDIVEVCEFLNVNAKQRQERFIHIFRLISNS